jgi:flagella basal body P-ring formation protein FlgA
VGGRLIGVVAVHMQRSAPAEGWIYAKDHRAGTDAQSVRMQRATVDFASREPLAAVSFEPPAETRLRRRVRAGTPVRSDDFEVRPSVTRSSEVMVHRQGEGVRVSRTAIVLEDAFEGDATRVRIGDRVLRAQVSERENYHHAL